MGNFDEIFLRMESVYGGEGPQLDFGTEYQLLVAVILSAQCTDVRVNMVTDELYKTHGTPEAIDAMSTAELEEAIHSCGFFHAKAANIKATTRILLEKYGGRVPDTMEELTALPGVGRKTANVVLANAFGADTFAVDTHVFRTTRRLGLTEAKTPEGVERDMVALLPEGKRGAAHHWFIWHGRRVCHSQKPECATCFLNDICPKMMDRVR